MYKSLHHKNQLTIATTSGLSTQASASDISPIKSIDKIIIVEPSVDLNKNFIKTKLKKYFKNIFKDLSTIKSVPTASGATLIDKNAFAEYINCPGIVSDRLFTLAS
jgi:hypothetical protein